MAWTQEQQAAMQRTQFDLLVSAGAGSGKTTTMIERAVRLVLGGERYISPKERQLLAEQGDAQLALYPEPVPVNRITMLTFTNAAASEMKEKFRVRLVDELHRVTGKEARAYLLAQIEALPFAEISTIDGFCLSLVKEFFEQIPLPPNVGILDDEMGGILSEKALKEVLDSTAKDEKLDAMRTMVGMRNDNDLSDLILKLYADMTVQPDREGWLRCMWHTVFDNGLEGCPASKLWLSWVTDTARELCSKLRAFYGTSDDAKSDTAIATLLDKYQGFESCATVADVYKAYAICKANTKQVRLAGAKLKEELAPIHLFFKEQYLKYTVTPVVTICPYDDLSRRHSACAQFTESLISLVLSYEKAFERRKTELSLVDFADLEKYALVILSDPDLREEIRARRDYMFVDEYQDTNHVQESIIRAVTPHNRLFVVGDSKQCIYRFRQAEPAIFLDTLTSLEANNTQQVVRFVDNFRSDKQVLHFVNRVFDILMTPEFGGVDYQATDAFRLRPEAHDGGSAVVQVVCLPSDKASDEEDEELEEAEDAKEAKVYSVTDAATAKEADYREADIIARYIQDKVGKEVMVRGKPHTLEYKDIAILFRKRGSAPSVVLSRLMQKGIPLSLSSFVADVGARDLQLLIQYVFLLDNAQDDYPLLSVLRSAFAGFSDEELASIRKGVPYTPYHQVFAQYAQQDTPLALRARNFLTTLSALRFQSSFTPVHQLLLQVVYSTGYADRILMEEDGESRLLAIKSYILGLADKCIADSISSLASYYRTHDTSIKADAVDREDGVVVRTLHSSKGLEYPVVIMACTSESKSAKQQNNIFTDRELGIGSRYYNAQARTIESTFMLEVLRQNLARKEREDALRLFYVGMTRAQCYLLITGHECKTPITPASGNTFMGWLRYAIDADPTLAAHLWSPVMEGDIAPVQKVTREGEPLDIRVLDYMYPYADSTMMGKKYTVTGLSVHENHGEEILPSLLPKEEAQVGTNYHAVMQFIDYDLPTVEDVRQAIAHLVASGRVDARSVKDVDADKVFACLQLPLLRRAWAATPIREKRFVLAEDATQIGLDGRETVLIQGTIDLYFEEEGGMVLVDFKHSKRSDASLIDTYRMQLDLYARAICSATGKPVTHRYLIELGTARVIEVK